VQDNELLADADTVMASVRRTGFGSVVVKLESPAAFGAFRQWLTTNPALRVKVETQEAYNRRIAGRQTQFFIAMAWLAGGIMSIGALLGAFVAWLLFDGHEMVSHGALYVTAISAPVFGLGIAVAGALALLGSVLPAIHAARLAVATGLRAS
jgi:hypothetical protein